MNKLQHSNISRPTDGYNQGMQAVAVLRRIFDFLINFVNGAIAEARR